MAIPPRTTQTGTFFITTVTYNRRRLFQLPANAELFLETLQHYRAEGAYKLHAFVVMPDHVHLLLTPTGKTISQTVNLIKGGFSHRLSCKFPAWQRGFADHLVLNADHFLSRRDYIHQNPVRAHLSACARTTPTPPPTRSPSSPDALHVTNRGRPLSPAERHPRLIPTRHREHGRARVNACSSVLATSAWKAALFATADSHAGDGREQPP